MTNLSGTNLNSRDSGGPVGEGRESPSNFPGYPEYKKGDSDWVGIVPVNWELCRGRWLFRNKREAPKASDEQLSATQKYGVIPQSHFMESEDQKVTLALSGTSNFRHVDAGDFVISLRSFQGGIEWSRYSGCVSPAYTVMEPSEEVVHSYYRYLLKSDDFISYLNIISDSIRDGKTISYGQFSDIVFPVPPKADQRIIAAFLDHETDKIDALIEEQKRLIELLKEKRQAVISHAVTKGLDPNAPMKDSGVEWLGEVPEHWRLIPVWILFEMGRGRVISNDDIAENPGSYPVYSSQTEENGVIGYIDTFDFDGDYLTWTTDGANAGTVFRREGKFNCTNVCGTLKPRLRDVDLDYLWSAVSISTMAFVRHDINPKLMNGVMASIRVPVPPLPEQREIATRVAWRIEETEALVLESESTIGLLRERRSALISAAVTGKIDVRDWQPPASETQTPETTRAGATA